VLPGCGSSSNGKPIPNDPANRMVALIGQADSQSAAGICGGAKAKVREAQTVLQNEVPSSVDKDVRQGLADGMNRMISLIDQECQRPQPTQTHTTTSETTTTPTTTTPTTTTPTTTTPTTTTPTTTTPTTTTPTTTTPTTTTGTSTGNGGTPTSTGGVGAPPSSGGGQG
jgi:hypothetical protein